MLWTRLILAIAKSWNLKPESGTWKQEESIGFLSNVKMCFCLLVELDVFVLFFLLPQEMVTFSTKSLHFPGGVPKKQKKPKILVFRPRLRPDSKFFLFFVWYLLTKWQRFPAKACIFLEGYQKNKKKQRFWTLRPRLRQDSKIFHFLVFWYLSGNVQGFEVPLDLQCSRS